MAKEILLKEDNVKAVQAPVTVVGDGEKDTTTPKTKPISLKTHTHTLSLSLSHTNKCICASPFGSRVGGCKMASGGASSMHAAA
jgi:hypothetical protein